MRKLAAAVALALLAGCASGVAPQGGGPSFTGDPPVDSRGVVVDGTPVPTPYPGPMSAPVTAATDAPEMERASAARRALECDSTPYQDGVGSDYASGLATVRRSAEDALAAFVQQGQQVPQHGYRVERRDAHRILFSYDVDLRTKVAFVAYDGVRDYVRHTGWGIETWAMCDPSELPPDVTDRMAIGVWTDRAGSRVPVRTVQSYAGPEHCDWQDITFLILGPGTRGGVFLRDTTGELAELLRTSYSAHATLPTDAKDTGYRHDGRELWVARDRSAAYLVSLANPADVERWPGAEQGIGCA